jgi:hypothetical protein
MKFEMRPSPRRAAQWVARFGLAARALRAHKRHYWLKGPQVGRLDPQESWAKP